MIRGFEIVNDEFRKYINTDITLPRRATNKSSGYDFYIPIDVIIKPNERILIWSDVKAYMLDDEEILLFPRSSLGVKGLILSNVLGKIDSDYYSNKKNDGNIGLTLWNTSNETIELKANERICQGTFYKYLTADNDNPISNNRNGGFGSSGNK